MTDAKSKVRKGILFNRRLLHHEDFEQRNTLLIQNLVSFILKKEVKSVHCFLPIERNNEPNTWPLIKHLSSHGLKVVVSATNFEEETMSHYWYNDHLHFVQDRFDIPTPTNGDLADVEAIDLVVIPLLAADKTGNRIGYGRGYYDRMLKEMPGSVLKMGVSLGPLFDHFTFAEDHDISLDYVITPFETVHCNND